MTRSCSIDCWIASRRHCHRSRRASPLAATNALRKRQAERDIRLHVCFLCTLRCRERAVEMLAVGFVRLRAEGAVLGRTHRAPRRRAPRSGRLRVLFSAISRASPNRFRNEAAVRRLASSAQMRSVTDVRMIPGAMQLTLTWGANSPARLRVQDATAALAAA